MNGKEKQNQYAIQMDKLKKATYDEFYYEAIFIEYAIFEDRLESLLRHAKIPTVDKENRPLKISVKLNKIKSRKEFQDKYIQKHITIELIDNITKWKKERDSLVHNLMSNTFNLEELKNVALQGECLAKKLSNKSKLVNEYLDKNDLQ